MRSVVGEAHVAKDAVNRRWRIIYYSMAWCLGLIYLSTGVGKSLDVRGFREVLRNYNLYPSSSLWFIALGMAYVELFIAWSFLTGKQLRWGIIGSYLISGGGAIVLTIELLRQIHLQNCGCWGVFMARPLQWYTPLEDVIMVGMTIALQLTMSSRRQRSTAVSAEREARVAARLGVGQT